MHGWKAIENAQPILDELNAEDEEAKHDPDIQGIHTLLMQMNRMNAGESSDE